jgi:hypothetical protein
MSAKYTARMPVRRLVTALTLAVVLGVAFSWLQSRDGATPASEPTPSLDETTAAEFAHVTPDQWQAAFPLTLPDLQPFGGAVQAPVDRDLANAHGSLMAGRYGEAATRFESIWMEHPDRLDAALYLGITRLFLDEVPNGIEILRQAQGSSEPHIAAYAQWYALVGIARLREPGSGMVEAREVCERPGPFSARACGALERLGAPREPPSQP